MFNRRVVPRGAIRARMQRTARYRILNRAPVENDTTAQARAEIAAIAPTRTIEDGQRELADLIARGSRR